MIRGTEGGSSSSRVAENHSNATRVKKFGNSVLNRPCCRNHESRESSNEQFSVNPWAIFDHPHTTRQGEIHQTDYNKENEIEKSNEDESTKLRFNTKAKTQAARGHILHTWGVLLDMGEQGLEVTLPQLAQGTCKSQTISSISFGSQGGKTVDVLYVDNHHN